MPARSTSARVPRARSPSRTSSARSMRTRSTMRRMNLSRSRRPLPLFRRKHHRRQHPPALRLCRLRSRRKLPRSRLLKQLRRPPSRKLFNNPRHPPPRRSFNNPCNLLRKLSCRSRFRPRNPLRTPCPQADQAISVRTARKSGCNRRHAHPLRLTRRPKRSSDLRTMHDSSARLPRIQRLRSTSRKSPCAASSPLRRIRPSTRRVAWELTNSTSCSPPTTVSTRAQDEKTARPAHVRQVKNPYRPMSRIIGQGVAPRFVDRSQATAPPLWSDRGPHGAVQDEFHWQVDNFLRRVERTSYRPSLGIPPTWAALPTRTLPSARARQVLMRTHLQCHPGEEHERFDNGCRTRGRRVVWKR